MNRKKRFEIAAVVLADARKENRDGKVVLVEGKRDVRALKNLGFNCGPKNITSLRWYTDIHGAACPPLTPRRQGPIKKSHKKIRI